MPLAFPQALALYGAVLGPERLTYGFVYHYTPSFRRICNLGATGKADLTIMHTLVSTFKVVQILAVASDLGPKLKWSLPLAAMVADESAMLRLAVGLALIAFGQLLNASIYWAIGSVGVHYGHQLGHTVPWCEGWPFTFLSNPQYIGVVLTFWGIYLALAPSWTDYEWFTIPLVISFWYFWSCNLLEAGTPRHTLGKKRA
jgi:methylene-fatty-acyl-phospholipid synthase